MGITIKFPRLGNLVNLTVTGNKLYEPLSLEPLKPKRLVLYPNYRIFTRCETQGSYIEFKEHHGSPSKMYSGKFLLLDFHSSMVS